MSLPCAAYNFGLLSGSLLCFIVWNPIRKNQIGATNPNVDTRNVDVAKKKSKRKGIFIRPNEKSCERTTSDVQSNS